MLKSGERMEEEGGRQLSILDADNSEGEEEIMALVSHGNQL